MIKKILNFFKKPQMIRKSVSHFDQIQSDILSNEDLSIILRKAKVIAYKIKNQEFKDWIENELNGYNDDDLLPEYRKIFTIAQGDFLNTRWHYKSVEIPLHNIPENLHHFFNEINVTDGVKGLESHLETIKKSKNDFLKISIPAEFTLLLSNIIYDNLNCVAAWRVLTKGNINQILETTRNNLLNFILELADKYPELKSDAELTQQIPNEQIKQVFINIILGGKHQIIGSSNHTTQGDNMSVFDQRGQNVQTQYNAAGDINFSSVQNSTEFVAELIKLRNEFSKVAQEESIDAEIVTDTEYQLTKAIQQSEKAQPDKGVISNHLENAKKMVDGIDTSIKIVKTFGPYIDMAIEQIYKVYG
jgi:AbiTii